ncbi:MAG TPA: DUF4231 domain-containing protein [Streptosporangiaceae bacterium]
MKRPALVVRFPKPFWWRPDPDGPWSEDWPVLPEDADERYPQLVPDFQIWRNKLERPFRRLDHEAQLLQHQFWRQQVTLIVGGLLVTALGAYQAASGGGNKGTAAAQAVLAGLLTGLAALARARRAQQGYLTARLKAERIKSEFFLFMGRVGAYAEADREGRLEQRVEDIADAEGGN